ncbi:hypothetical protein niasHT_017861 [Heterodera trifolii]|uniref:Uncharacterized protein n=1 Tax=Heterodera trifolii TaxID=157864 RepID=A0ABD2LDI3_9BILA
MAFSPRPDGVPKVLKCYFGFYEDEWPSQLERLKTAFSNASSRVNFIVFVCLSFDDFFVPFDLTNEMTGERLTLKSADKNNKHFLLIRCPISRDENKWTKWEKEAIELEFKNQWNKIAINV